MVGGEGLLGCLAHCNQCRAVLGAVWGWGCQGASPCPCSSQAEGLRPELLPERWLLSAPALFSLNHFDGIARGPG